MILGHFMIEGGDEYSEHTVKATTTDTEVLNHNEEHWGVVVSMEVGFFSGKEPSPLEAESTMYTLLEWQMQ